MLPHRSDTSRGHLHPPTCPRLMLPPALSHSLLFHPEAPSRPYTAQPGWFPPVPPLMPPLSWGRLRGFSSLFPTATSLQLPGPPRNPPSFSSTSSSYRSTMQRPLSTRQIFPPPSGTTLRPVGEERSFTGFLGLPIVRSRASTTTMCSRRMSHPSGAGWTRATIEGDLLAKI